MIPRSLIVRRLTNAIIISFSFREHASLHQFVNQSAIDHALLHAPSNSLIHNMMAPSLQCPHCLAFARLFFLTNFLGTFLHFLHQLIPRGYDLCLLPRIIKLHPPRQRCISNVTFQLSPFALCEGGRNICCPALDFTTPIHVIQTEPTSPVFIVCSCFERLPFQGNTSTVVPLIAPLTSTYECFELHDRYKIVAQRWAKLGQN